MKNINFLETINLDNIEQCEKGSYRGTSKHPSLYTNKQGRMFNFKTSDQKNEDVFNKHYTINTLKTADGVDCLAIKQLTDAEAKKLNDKADFKVSEKSTKTPFLTVTELCKKLFGQNKQNWAHDFELQGEKQGYLIYTLVSSDEATSQTADAE